jgi:acyl carrier protein
VNSESDSTTIEAWDSLGHISILAHLDQKFNNITENCPELAAATSVKEILTILNKQLK